MLKCSGSQSTLCFDVSDKITTHEEAYACTHCQTHIDPCARAIVHVERVNEKDGHQGDCVRYGQQLRFAVNPFLLTGKRLYLHSQQISPLSYARYSRNQEVCITVNSSYNTVWRLLPVDMNLMGQPVDVSQPVKIEHCATCELLSGETFVYINDFGKELEVSVKTQAVAAKTQCLEGESKGIRVRDTTHKQVSGSNLWSLGMARCQEESNAELKPVKYTYESLIQEVKDKLISNGCMGIRGINKIFRILDENRNGQLELSELQWGLNEFGIAVNEEQTK